MRKTLALLVLCAASLTARAFAGDLRFDLIDNRVFVPVMLDGKGPYRIVLDTGAPGFFISTPVMTALGIKATGSEASEGAGEGRDTAYRVKLATVALGDAVWRNADADAQSLEALNDVIGFRHFDGVIGKPVFDRFAVDMDFATSTIRLLNPKTFVPPKNAVAVPFEFYQGFLPVVRGTIAGVSGKFLVDLGDRSSLTLFGPFWRAHKLDTAFGKTLDALTGYGIGGPIRSLVARVPAFRFGDVTRSGVVARLSLQKAGGFNDPMLAGSIGTGILKHYRVVIDYPHRRFVLVPHDSDPDRYDRTGVWLGRHGDAFAVFDVIAQSPASEAGLKVGDVVTAVNGVPAAKLDLFALRETLRDPANSAPVTLAYTRSGIAHSATLHPRELLPHS